MQIQIDLNDKEAPERGALLSAIFTFVARDRNTGKAAPINALEPPAIWRAVRSKWSIDAE